MGAGLIDTFWKWWGFPFSCCEATKDKALSCLNDSESPSLLIAFTMEIICSPPISGSIKNPLESGTRILVSYEFDNHLPVTRDPKSLGNSKICLRVIFLIRDRQNRLRNRYFGYLLSFGFFRSRLWLRFSQQFLGIFEVSLRFREFLRKLLKFFIRFF